MLGPLSFVCSLWPSSSLPTALSRHTSLSVRTISKHPCKHLVYPTTPLQNYAFDSAPALLTHSQLEHPCCPPSVSTQLETRPPTHPVHEARDPPSHTPRPHNSRPALPQTPSSLALPAETHFSPAPTLRIQPQRLSSAHVTHTHTRVFPPSRALGFLPRMLVP